MGRQESNKLSHESADKCPANARWLLRMRIRSTAPPRCHTRGLPSARKVLAPARPARDSPGVRVRQEIARQSARRVGREAGVGRVVAALREVAAQAGLEDCAGVVLFVSAAAGQVIPHDDLQHVGGERVERNHGGWWADRMRLSQTRLVECDCLKGFKDDRSNCDKRIAIRAV